LSSLLDDLRRAPTPLQFASRDDLVSELKDAEIELLRAALSASAPTTAVVDSAFLRRYALWLEDVAIHEPADDTYHLLASSIFDFVGRLHGSNEATTSLFLPPISDLLRSSILASLSSYPGQGNLIARRIANRMRSLVRGATSPSERCHFLAGAVVASFLARDYVRAISDSVFQNTLIVPSVDELESRNAGEYELHALDTSLAISQACARASAGMYLGAPNLVLSARRFFQTVVIAAQDAEDGSRAWLSGRLAEACTKLFGSSMHRILREAGFPDGYIRNLARDGYTEFWGPQLDAIKQGILDPYSSDNFVISIPTGTGKTLLAELLILSTLNKDDGQGWCLYVTPSRALVSQVSNDMRHRLDSAGIKVNTFLAGGEQSLLLDEEIGLITQSKAVTVTTPEKLDAYFRNAKEIFSSCRVAVFDEAHKIADGERGALLESLITRLRIQQTPPRICLMSGVMSNFSDFVSWLGADSTKSVVSRRRATRQTRGVAVRHPPFQIGQPRSLKAGFIRPVKFQGGLVIVHEEDDLGEDFEVTFPDIFEGFYSEKQYYSRWQEFYRGAHSSFNDHAMAIASRLSPLPGPIVVFVQQTGWAESCCEKVLDSQEFPAERARLAAFVRLELGANHPLVGHCLRGVAYHHARLPNSVQRAIELALERGWLKVVFSTPTLREGVNTAATTVILAGDTQYDGGRVPVSEFDFENLAGRAGRPRIDNEGRVLLVPDHLAMADVKEVGKKYLLAGTEALRVKSQLEQLAHRLQENDSGLRGLSPSDQSLVLGLKAAGLDQEDLLTSFIEQSLWAVQERNDDLVENTSAQIGLDLQAAAEQVGDENLALAAKLGLSFTSAEALRERLLTSIDVFEDVPSWDRNKAIETLLAAVLEIPEVNSHGLFQRHRQAVEHLQPVIGWIDGLSYEEILIACREANLLTGSADVSDSVSYCSDVSTWLSWAFGAAILILESATSNAHEQLKTLPLLVKYGVPTLAAAYISLLGVSDRRAAFILGNEFSASGEAIGLSEIRAWMDKMADRLDELFPPEQHYLRTELLFRQAFRLHRDDASYVFTRFSSDSPVALGGVASFSAEGGDVLVSIDGSVVGQAIDVDRIMQFTSGRLQEYVGIVTARRTSERETGAIGVVRLASQN
jgi:hypothetical protein